MAEGPRGGTDRDVAKYRRYYWCIGLADTKRTEVFCHVDRVEVTPSGAVVMRRDDREAGTVYPNLVFASGQWAFVYAASVLDGHAVAVRSWPGQIEVSRGELAKKAREQEG